jgi:hypothetical protein
MIDRTMLGYVVDMIDCRFINFAVFNVADSFVCIGAGLMILYVIVFSLREMNEPSATGYHQVAEQYAGELGCEDGADAAETSADMGEIAPETADTPAEDESHD